MGGRIALSLANHQQVQGVIALSSHPGLSSPLHRQERLASDLRWKQRLQTLPCEEFLSLWYQQEVFSSLQESPELFQHLLIKRRYQNKEELASVLEMMSLAHQPSFSHCIVPSYFLYGEKDMKAHTLYTKLTGCYTVESIPLCGHTLHLENPTLLTSKIHSWVHKHFEGRQPI